MNPNDYAAKKIASIELNPDPTATTKTTTKTGPKTEAGKKRSACNSTRHGLSGRVVVLPSEDMDLYLAQSKEVVESLNPETPVEYELAQTVADGYWRMKRLRTVEEGLFAWGTYEEAGNFDAETPDIHAAFTAAKAFRTNSNAFVNLSIYEQRIQRGIEKALKQLKEIQTERRALQTEALKEALRLRELDRMLEKAGAEPMYRVGPASETDPTRYRVNQFVYSSAELDRQRDLRNRREAALRAEKAGFRYQEFIKLAA